MTPDALYHHLNHLRDYQEGLGRSPATTKRLLEHFRTIGPELTPSLARALMALFRAIGHLPKQRLPRRRLLFAVARALEADPTHALWGATLEAIAAYSASPSAPCFTGPVLDLAHTRALARSQHRPASLEPLIPRLEALARSLFGYRAQGQLVASHRHTRTDTLSASTDGTRIELPELIDLCAEEDLNALAYVHLLAHEVGHLVAGSFVPHISDPDSRLDRLLAPRRGVFERRDGTDAWAELGLPRRTDPGVRMAQHVYAALHMEEPRVFLTLVNLVEDLRVDRWIASRHPLLGRLADYFEGVERERRPHRAFLSHEQNFLVALQALIREPSRPRQVAPRLRPALNALAAELVEAHRRGLSDLVDVIVVAARLHDLLRKHLPGDLSVHTPVPAPHTSGRRRARPSLVTDGRAMSGRIRDLLVSRVDPGFVDAEPEVSSETIEDPADAHQGSEELLSGREDKDLSEGRRAYVYYEVDRRSSEHGYDAARVYVEDVVDPLPDIRPRPPSAARFELEGDELDLDRAYDALVALRTPRRPADARIYRRSVSSRRVLPEPSPEGAEPVVAFLVDLTPSMWGGTDASRHFPDERDGPAPRGLAPASVPPMFHVQRLLERLLPELEAAGHRTEVFGGADFGRKDARLIQLKRADEPASAPWSKRLFRPDRIGFRHGAYIRHLGSRPAMRAPSSRIVLLCDTASHYIGYGLEGFLAKVYEHMCENCTPGFAHDSNRRPGLFSSMCDPSAPRSGLEGHVIGVFLESLVELQDLRWATAECPSPVHGVFFGAHWRDSTLDWALGPDGWSRVREADDVDDTIRRLTDFVFTPQHDQKAAHCVATWRAPVTFLGALDDRDEEPTAEASD